jgi:hypothetical protein
MIIAIALVFGWPRYKDDKSKENYIKEKLKWLAQHSKSVVNKPDSY